MKMFRHNPKSTCFSKIKCEVFNVTKCKYIVIACKSLNKNVNRTVSHAQRCVSGLENDVIRCWGDVT